MHKIDDIVAIVMGEQTSPEGFCTSPGAFLRLVSVWIMSCCQSVWGLLDRNSKLQFSCRWNCTDTAYLSFDTRLGGMAAEL